MECYVYLCPHKLQNGYKFYENIYLTMSVVPRDLVYISNDLFRLLYQSDHEMRKCIENWLK
jgi:hypothetical protein